MISLSGVLGCAWLCWVGFSGSAQAQAAPVVALRAVCRVCWVSSCARMCNSLCLLAVLLPEFFSYARNKPSTLSTPSTVVVKALVYKGFSCAWFVLGWAVSVLGLVLVGEWA